MRTIVLLVLSNIFFALRAQASNPVTAASGGGR